MGLDFTALDNIRKQTAQEDFSEPLGSEAGQSATTEEKPATGGNTALQGHIHTHKLDKERLERENMRKAYREYQQNIRRSGTLRAEVLKGIQRGEEPLDLLLKAMECISKMTGDIAIYSQSQKDIQNHPQYQKKGRDL